MNKLAQELNEIIEESNPHLYNLLSRQGQRLYFPKGILSQSAEAKQKAHKFNATIGIALEDKKAMHFKSIKNLIPDLEPNEIFPYAPAGGLPGLRTAWKEKMVKENPGLKNKHISNPVVSSGITNGLSIVGELFVDQGDIIVLPDKLWGNYYLTFEVMKQAAVRTFPMFTKTNEFNLAAFEETVNRVANEKGKIIIILNFPNNPTGYTPTKKEAEAIVKIIENNISSDVNCLIIFDDAYYGLFYENTIKTSLFQDLACLRPNIVCIKLDGATKEEFVWGFRVGFITYGIKTDKNLDELYTAIEKKTYGAIRGTISNSPLLSQSLILRSLTSDDFEKEQKEKFEIMKARAKKVKSVLQSNKYQDAFEAYPFNSGYFMCMRLKQVNAEKLRLHLLDKYGIGIISIGENDIRVAFSATEVSEIEELFETIYTAAKELSA